MAAPCTTRWVAAPGVGVGVVGVDVVLLVRRPQGTIRTPVLFSIGLDGRDRRRIAGGAFPGMTPTGDRRAIFFRGIARRGGGRRGSGGGARGARALKSSVW